MSVIERSLLDFLGFGLDDGHLLFDLGKALIAELVGLGDVWGDVGVRTFEIWKSWTDKFSVAGVGQVNALLPIWVVLEGVDGVMDNRVGGEVL
jgi:hypothetical protein